MGYIIVADNRIFKDFFESVIFYIRITKIYVLANVVFFPILITNINLILIRLDLDLRVDSFLPSLTLKKNMYRKFHTFHFTLII